MKLVSEELSITINNIVALRSDAQMKTSLIAGKLSLDSR